MTKGNNVNILYRSLLILLLIIPGQLVSQGDRIDILKQKLTPNLPDTVLVDLLNKLSYELIKSNSLYEGYEYAEKAMMHSLEFNYHLGLARAYSNLGHFYQYSDNYYRAIEYYSKSYEVCDGLRDTCNMAKLYCNMGRMFSEMSSFDTALRYYRKSRYLLLNQDDSTILAEIFSGMGQIYCTRGEMKKSLDYMMESLIISKCTHDMEGMGKAYCNIGPVYRRIGDYEKAFDYFEKSFEVDNNVTEERSIIDSYIQVGIIYEETGEYEKALANYNKGLDIAKRLNYRKKIADCLNNIGSVYYDIGDHELALEHYFKSLDIKQSIGDKHGVTVVTNNIALTYMDLQKLKKISHPNNEIKYFGSNEYIVNLLLNAEKSAMATGIYQDLFETYNSLIIFYVDNNQFKDAVTFLEKLLVLNDSVFTIDKNKKLIELQAQFEVEQKEQQIKILNAKNIAQMSKMKRQDREMYFYFGGGITMILFVIGLISRMNFIRNAKNEMQSKNRLIETEKLRAEQSKKVKEKFLSNMSYEIRTPMSSVIGMTDILIGKSHSPEQKKYLEAVKQSSENLLVIINDILDFSKLETGKIELENTEFAIHDEIRGIIEILKYKAEERNLELLYEPDKNLPQVLIGDKARLNQVLINLLGNAIKFSEKGVIKITAKQVKSVGNSSRILFKVIDNGIGIPGDKLDKIFESFTQADTDTVKRYGGTGLGLSISKQLIQLQKGSISVQSEVGKGSTFQFELQVEIGSAVNDSLASGIIHEKLAGISVLIIEDNEFNAMVAMDELESLIDDVKIRVAENGHEALEIIKNQDFDVILMDIQLPVMDGYDTTLYIRKLKAPKSMVPIIAMTANTSRKDIEMCYKYGMNDVITKPFSTDLLIAKISSLLR